MAMCSTKQVKQGDEKQTILERVARERLPERVTQELRLKMRGAALPFKSQRKSTCSRGPPASRAVGCLCQARLSLANQQDVCTSDRWKRQSKWGRVSGLLG